MTEKNIDLKAGDTRLSAWLSGGTLHLAGEGVIPNYDDDRRPPWYADRNRIREVEMHLSGPMTIG
ncbi:MAG: hypothetical protein LBL42_07790, partial [Tannerella sp.]|nr:hypothetical protein [Tannerella sp.]